MQLSFLLVIMSSLILVLSLLVFVDVSSGVPSARHQIRIVGGNASAQGKWPFFAGLFFNRTTDEVGPYCGGVVWDKDTVLTAAHCIVNHPSTEPGLFEIYLGHNDWTGEKDQTYLFKAKEIFIHPSFKTKKGRHDLAVIRLERSIDFDGDNKKVECVCDPEPLDYLDTSACVAMGWGKSENGKKPTTLLEVVIPIVDDAFCQQNYPTSFDPSSLLCAGYVIKKAAGTCHGDSGGPLVCPILADPNKYSLVGIAAFGKKRCGSKPNSFTKVDHYLKWIRQITAQVGLEELDSFWQKLKGLFVGKSNTTNLENEIPSA